MVVLWKPTPPTRAIDFSPTYVDDMTYPFGTTNRVHLQDLAWTRGHTVSKIAGNSGVILRQNLAIPVEIASISVAARRKATTRGRGPFWPLSLVALALAPPIPPPCVFTSPTRSALVAMMGAGSLGPIAIPTTALLENHRLFPLLADVSGPALPAATAAAAAAATAAAARRLAAAFTQLAMTMILQSTSYLFDLRVEAEFGGGTCRLGRGTQRDS